MFDYFKGISVELLQIKVFNALVTAKVLSRILFVTNLAHHQNSRTLNFDVFKELLPGQVLEVLNVAEIASKLRAIELSMVLQLGERLPDNFVSSVLRLAFMWEFTEVDHVFENFVYFFHEVAARLTVGAANVILRSSLVHL